MISYTIRSTIDEGPLVCDWQDPAWATISTLDIANFRPESSNHHPVTQARLSYSPQGISGIFRVQDQYVRCIRTAPQSSVCKDSCVEFFVRPDQGDGYFNFEFNCGGTMLCHFVRDPRREADGPLRSFSVIAPQEADKVTICSSMPSVMDPEHTDPITWTLAFRIPFTVLEAYAGPLGDIPGRTWRANLYKCGDETSHPHWAAWSPVSRLNFHLPDCFGEIVFG